MICIVTMDPLIIMTPDISSDYVIHRVCVYLKINHNLINFLKCDSGSF